MTIALRRRLVILLAALLVGCGSGHAKQGEGSPEIVVAGADSSYEVHLPFRWVGRYKVDTLSTAERGRARPDARVFIYLPADSTLHTEALLVVAVYDSAAWSAVRAAGGPPPGDSMLAHAGLVYVVTGPQSNPFAANSPDAFRFNLLQLRPEELRAVVQLRQPLKR
ncbi:MAG: hypothetical protein ACHQXA_08355 [Gemmatimonadales bacterium]